ncbi:MAG: diguanylate cyclase [Pseudomonadota bacterium]
MRTQQQYSIPGNDFSGSLRVLIAEQEQAIRDALAERVYNSLGVQADTVNTASAVRKLLKSGADEFVLAVVDTRLPDAPDGEVLEVLTQNSIPTIALSSSVNENVVERMQDRHIIDCVLKRTDEDIELLADIVERTLRNHQRKIIFFSNNDFNRKSIRQLLDIHRYTIIDVRNEAEIRRQLGSHPETTLVLIDYLSIEQEELELINSLRQQYRREDLAIAVVCDEHSSRSSARMLRAGATDVIYRQHQTDEFYYRVHQCVESIERVREIKYSATRDLLTGVYNRDYVFDIGEKLFASAMRGDSPLAVAVIQIDNIGDLTTTHGIDVSNAVLKETAGLLSDEFRKNDVLARYSADTFICLATNVGSHNARMIFERVRQKLAKASVECQSHIATTSATIGVATSANDTLLSMIANAQAQLDSAIEGGRNRISVED